MSRDFFNVLSIFLYLSLSYVLEGTGGNSEEQKQLASGRAPLPTRDAKSIRGSQYKINVGGELAFMVLMSGQNIVTLLCVRDLKGIFLDRRKGTGSQT